MLIIQFMRFSCIWRICIVGVELLVSGAEADGRVVKIQTKLVPSYLEYLPEDGICTLIQEKYFFLRDKPGYLTKKSGSKTRDRLGST